MLLALLAVPARHGWASSVPAQPHELWRWSEDGFELTEATFMHHGDEIVIAKLHHEPDGEEAEVLEDLRRLNWIAAFNAVIAAYDGHFAEPTIVLYGADRKTQTLLGYGWTPVISPDDARIAFVRQVQPIAGLRIGAPTLAGNEIWAWERATRQATLVAKPSTGHLDHPSFSVDGDTLYFTVDDAMNGFYPGSVGLYAFRFSDRQQRTLLPRNDVSGVACLLADRALVGTHVFAAQQCPAPSDYGEPGSLASEYWLQVIDVSGEPHVVYTWPKPVDQSDSSVKLSATQDGKLRIVDSRTHDLDPATGRIVREFRTGTHKSDLADVHAQVNDNRTQIDFFGAHGHGHWRWRTRGEDEEIGGAIWSADGRRVGVKVAQANGEIFLRDELVVLELEPR